MSRYFALGYGIGCYLIALACLVYLYLFIGNIQLAHSLDSTPRMHWMEAAFTDAGLLALFCLQHSLMARESFKRHWRRIVPAHLERSTYVLLTSIALGLIFAHWQPIGGDIWRAESDIGRGILYGMFAFGWLTVAVAIALTNHLDLFGIRHVWAYFRQRPYERPPFTTRWLYRYVRHPLYLGWLFAFWAAPTMTLGHFLFALLTSFYIVAAIPYEEADLLRTFGRKYAEYRARVPKFIPALPRRNAGETFVLDSEDRYVGPDDINRDS